MRRRTLCRILTLGLLAWAPEVLRAEEPDESLLAFTRRPLAHPVPAASDVRVVADQRFAEDRPDAFLDLYLPGRAAGPVPVVLLVHGGLGDEVAIRPRDWQGYRDWGTLLASRGLAAVMYNHRLGFPDLDVEGALGDVAAVRDWIDAHASEHGLDTGRVAVVSFSAGGLLLPGLVRAREARPLAAVAAFYPLLGLHPEAPTAPFDTAEKRAATSFRDAVPEWAASGIPLLLLRAGADQIPALLEILDEAVPPALAADLDLELMNLPGAAHGFDVGEESAASRRAIDRGLAFLDERLRTHPPASAAPTPPGP